MKTSLSLTGPALAALGISLTLVSCEDKGAEPSDPPEKKSSSKANPVESGADGGEKATPPVDLESEVIGYWAPDAEAMMKAKGPEEEDSIEALRTEMLAAMTFEIPEKGKVVMHMMGDSLNMSYTVKTIDEATKTLSVEITDPDGETESGAFIIGEDKLKLSTGGDEPDLSLVRIDEAAFKKRKVVLPNILDLPEGPDPEEGDTTEPAPGN